MQKLVTITCCKTNRILSIVTMQISQLTRERKTKTGTPSSHLRYRNLDAEFRIFLSSINPEKKRMIVRIHTYSLRFVHPPSLPSLSPLQSNHSTPSALFKPSQPGLPVRPVFVASPAEPHGAPPGSSIVCLPRPAASIRSFRRHRRKGGTPRGIPC